MDERTDDAVDSLSSLSVLMEEFRRVREDIPLDEFASCLGMSVKEFNRLIKDEDKLLVYLKKGGRENLSRVFLEFKNNAIEGKKMLKEMLHGEQSVSERSLARFLGYSGRGYQNLEMKKYWSHSLYERVNSARCFFLGKESRQSDVNFMNFLDYSSLMFVRLYRFFILIEGYREGLVSLRQVAKGVLDVCDVLVEKFQFAYGAVIVVVLEVAGDMIASKSEGFLQFLMSYLKQNRKKEIVEGVKKWLSMDDAKKEDEKRRVLIVLNMIFMSFYRVLVIFKEMLGLKFDFSSDGTIKDVVHRFEVLRVLRKERRFFDEVLSVLEGRNDKEQEG